MDANAQEKTKNGKNGFFKRTADKIFNPKVKYDTTYIGRPWGKWAFSVNENLSQHRFYQLYESKFIHTRNNMTATTGIGASYKGIGFSYSMDFDKISGKSNDKDMTFNLYGNSYGLDVNFFSVGDLHNPERNYSMLSDARLYGFSANAYYVFNNKKFSYPAAFSYSQIQKKNAGSIIAGVSFYDNKLDFGANKETYESYINELVSLIVPDSVAYHDKQYCGAPSNWKTQYISLGVGYAYNWVPTKRWLIHASAEISQFLYQNVTVTVNDLIIDKEPYSQASVEISSRTYKAPYCFFDFSANGRFSATYSWERGYIGAYYVATMSYIKLPEIEQSMSVYKSTINHWWNARISVGFRF